MESGSTETCAARISLKSEQGNWEMERVLGESMKKTSHPAKEFFEPCMGFLFETHRRAVRSKFKQSKP